MNKKNIFLFGLVVSLLLGNVWLFSVNKSIKNDVKLNEDKLIGVRASLDSLNTRYDNLDSTVKAIEEDDGKLLKTEYSEQQDTVKEVFERYYAISKEKVQAKLNKEESKFKALKQEESQVIALGDYVDYEFFRGANWSMVYYDKLPDFTKSDIPYGVIGIMDESGRAVALLRVLFVETEQMFQLVSVDTTLEWLASTEAYPTSGEEVGELVDGQKGES